MISIARATPFLSVITPAYNEARNLPIVYARLRAALEATGINWEWIIVDDASDDDTFSVAETISADDGRVCVLRLSRNFGSHTALICGLDHARGDCAVVMASDLQDPPETIPELLALWQAGSHVVWAVRARREGESRGTLAFARVYYWLMRRVAGLKEMPATGADFGLFDRRVIDAVRRFPERNASLFALITWMGFRQSSIFYNKQARVHGRSGWTLGKKIKLAVDSLTSFSYQPLRWMSVIGLTVALLGAIYALIVILNAFFGTPAQGWSSLMVVVLCLSGAQIFMLGILGEYVWRGLDEARRRPRYIIERIAGQLSGSQGEHDCAHDASSEVGRREEREAVMPLGPPGYGGGRAQSQPDTAASIRAAR